MHPAFVDCAQALMRRRGEDLLLEISESALFRLGRAISANLNILTAEDPIEYDITGPSQMRSTPRSGSPSRRACAPSSGRIPT